MKIHVLALPPFPDRHPAISWSSPLVISTNYRLHVLPYCPPSTFTTLTNVASTESSTPIYELSRHPPNPPSILPLFSFCSSNFLRIVSVFLFPALRSRLSCFFLYIHFAVRRRLFTRSCFRFCLKSYLYLLASVSYVLSNVRIPHAILIVVQGLNSS